jgi:hypothetical protein
MDDQLFKIINGVAAFLAASALTMLFKKVFALERDLAASKLQAVEKFVAKEDHKSALDDLKTTMSELRSDVKEILRGLRHE